MLRLANERILGHLTLLVMAICFSGMCSACIGKAESGNIWQNNDFTLTYPNNWQIVEDVDRVDASLEKVVSGAIITVNFAMSHDHPESDSLCDELSMYVSALYGGIEKVISTKPVKMTSINSLDAAEAKAIVLLKSAYSDTVLPWEFEHILIQDGTKRVLVEITMLEGAADLRTMREVEGILNSLEIRQ